MEGAVAGAWSLGIVEQSQGEATVDCGEMDWGDVREEIVVGHAGGRKPGRPQFTGLQKVRHYCATLRT